MAMRGVETRIQEIRHRIFTEVARMAYHTEWPTDRRIEALPFDIMPGEVGNIRNDIFLERAIVGERLRLAMGLPCRSAAEHAPLSDNIEAATREETYYTPPLINVIKFACHACKENEVMVTDACQGCMAHPCVEVCPKGAVSLDRFNGRSVIDQEKCIKCGRCMDVCQYHAIIRQERPCAAKKLEAMRSDVRSEVDFVLTFEEMAGIFAARHIDVETLKEDPHGINDASTDGRNFAVSGGVAKAVVNVINEKYPDREIKVANAEGLRDCRKLLMAAKAGKYNGYLLEGMACPGGCVAGAGTMQSIKKSAAVVGMYAKQAEHQTATGTHHVAELDKLVD